MLKAPPRCYVRHMSRASTKLASIRKHLPRKRRLPKELGGFAKLVVSERGPRHDLASFTWTDPRPLLNADRNAVESLLPFLRLGDGGVVALFWHDDAEPSVVHCDSEGQYAVIATSFTDFLARLARPTPDFTERLELDAPIDTSSLVPKTRRHERIPAALSHRFATWVDSHSLSATPDSSADASLLAQKLLEIARHMLKDGLSRVYNLRAFHWTVELRVQRNVVTYLDYGKWIPLPATYDIAALLPQLSRLLKHPRARRFDISIWKDGHVFVDGGNQLTIEPRARD